MEQFYDAATWQNLPHGTDVALYGDGDFTAPPGAANALNARKVRVISVLGNYRIASMYDFEQGNPMNPGTVRAFVRGRRANGQDAIIYFDRSNAAEALRALYDYGHGALLDYPNLFYWVSTLDDVDWTADELAADLASNWDAPIPASKLFANQNRTGNYDSSNLYMPY